MAYYLKRTDGRNVAGEGRTIMGMSIRRDIPDTVVFIAEEQRSGDEIITQAVYEETLASNNAWTAANQRPLPPDPEPQFSQDELKSLRALLNQ